ncbi:amino acid ABC transporter permease [Mesorhizobium sp. B2-5-4]|uniref:amino acid ABC transporter permease n=1 Tax=unclassified Mesorhizobium TaxID=325217 RepID=UPI00112D7C9A|nr:MULTISPECIES: amino acid ABC transporter permease [unclassified Mesorhizobium]TPK44721.1 amino acid ABC transporter permease [Mesorhizobium sp. B2-5-4]TPM05389.1 amino acid ABC transporter permease [Mesorhizobium sp. B2-3-11]
MSLAELQAIAADWTPQLLAAAGYTLKMTSVAYIIGAVAGLLLALARLSQRRVISLPALVYIEFIRGTPTLTQLFLVYFSLALVGIVLPAFEAAVIALGLHYAAYMAETYRAGIEAIHRGQHEAAQAIGMTRAETMRYIILPQSLRIILPPMGNSAISLMKDTSVASLISAPELMLRAHDLTSEYYMPMQLYLIVGAMYLIMTYPLSMAVRHLERMAGKGRLSGRRR